MDTGKVTEIVQSGTKVLAKHSPKILTATGIVGMFGTILLAIKAKEKADLLIHEAKAVKAAEESEDGQAINIDEVDLTFAETVKAVFPAYWTVGASFILSSAAIIASDYISDKRQVALSAAYSIADMALKETQKKTVEMLGEKKAQQIEQAVVQDKMNTNPPSNDKVQYVMTNSEYSLFLAPVTEDPFCARIDDVHKVFNILNARINMGDEVMLNEILDELSRVAVSTPATGIGVKENGEIGQMFYWNSETGIIGYHFCPANVPNTELACNKIVIDTSSRCCIDVRRVDRY